MKTIKTKDCSTQKLQNEWEIYYKHKYQEAKAKNNWDSSLTKGFLKLFIFRKLAYLMNEVKALRSNYYWVIVHKDGGLHLKLTNFSPKVFGDAFDLATEKWWPAEEYDSASYFCTSLCCKHGLNYINDYETRRGILK